MANEISVRATLACKKQNFALPAIGGQDVKVTQHGIGGGAPGIVTVGPADELIDLSEITVPGWLRMFNIDRHQTVRWGPNNAGVMLPMGLMKPGEPALFRFYPSAGLRMMVEPSSEESTSDSAENQAKVQIFVLED